MSRKCEICGKGPQFGRNVSHSKRRTNRRFNPNLQKGKVTVGGKILHAKVCTSCLSRYAA